MFLNSQFWSHQTNQRICILHFVNHYSLLYQYEVLLLGNSLQVLCQYLHFNFLSLFLCRPNFIRQPIPPLDTVEFLVGKRMRQYHHFLSMAIRDQGSLVSHLAKISLNLALFRISSCHLLHSFEQDHDRYQLHPFSIFLVLMPSPFLLLYIIARKFYHLYSILFAGPSIPC